MATDKLFSVAGISKLNGNYKVRFANDQMRVKVLAKSGHEDIRLADLEKSVSKLEAAQMLLTIDEFSDAVAQATITEYIAENTPKTKANPAVSKAKAPAKAPKATKTKVTEDENVPFE
jgi:serine/threonine protein phosphatase PrpC